MLEEPSCPSSPSAGEPIHTDFESADGNESDDDDLLIEIGPDEYQPVSISFRFETRSDNILKPPIPSKTTRWRSFGEKAELYGDLDDDSDNDTPSEETPSDGTTSGKTPSAQIPLDHTASDETSAVKSKVDTIASTQPDVTDDLLKGWSMDEPPPVAEVKIDAASDALSVRLLVSSVWLSSQMAGVDG